MTAKPLLLLCAALGLAACSPSLNWREIKPAEAQGLVALFPCKPESAIRRLEVPGLAGGPVDMHVLSCQADDTRWALSYLNTGSPERLIQALPALDQALWANLSSSPSARTSRQAIGPTQVSGADTHAAARQWLLSGRRPVSTARFEPVQVKAWSFARGLTAFQASVWKDETQGTLQVDDPAVEAFARGFNFPR